MEGTDAADLGELLASADVPETEGGSGQCALCEDPLAADDAVVEVALDVREGTPGESGTDPTAWLCATCYEYVVGDVGVAPTRVFKAGPRRTVVLPVGAGNGTGDGASNGTEPPSRD